MPSKVIIEKLKHSIIQIATPYSTGTGFYLSEYDLIVTNEHVIRDNKEVVIDGESLEKEIVPVLYIDQKYDLAFLQAPKVHNMHDIHLRNVTKETQEGESIIAVGHPFGLKYTVTKGIISNMTHEVGSVQYLQHDAALNPGNSGGPLVCMNGSVIGVNTFVIKNGNNIGFSLPAKYLKETIDAFRSGNGQEGIRCTSCMTIVFENTIDKKYCTQCGSSIKLISEIESYEPTGINRTIEQMLENMGHDISLSRMGPSNWTVIKGSAKINIAYHEKSGLITGDAYLGTLPKENIIEIYEYLLRENYDLGGLTFSVKGQDIIISLLIFDQYLEKDTAVTLFENLTEAADHYDNILVEQYGAAWIATE